LLADEHRSFFNRHAAHWDDQQDRDVLLRLETIINSLGIKVGSRVLDAGTGTGVLLPALLRAVGASGQVTALDYAENMLAVARQKHSSPNLTFICADLADTPFLDDSFDDVICNNCFPHLTDMRGAVREMLRILKPGGRVVICHNTGREALNRMHQSVGGVVAGDMLPDNRGMKDLFFSQGFNKLQLNDLPDIYLFSGCKP
jgi:ubiquinone/menaquinone biosynthesis C-methylase UbiE